MSVLLGLKSFLIANGWTGGGIVSSGRVWTRGESVAVVPETLNPEDPAYRRLLQGIAWVHGVSFEDIDTEIRSRIVRTGALPSSSPLRTALDLHLSGSGVLQHETDAWRFGRFVAAISDSVKELVKDAHGMQRRRHSLQVVGGVGVGSVRVMLMEPAPPARVNQPGLPDHDAESPEGIALRTLGQIFNAANEAAASPSDSILEAKVQLDPGARKSLRTVARHAREAQWDAEGWVIQPATGHEPIPVNMTLAGADALWRATRDTDERLVERDVPGVLDGWTWSDGTMVLLDSDGQRVRATVPPEMQDQVARLVSARGHRVVAKFHVLERYGPKGARRLGPHGLVSLDVLE